MKIPETIEDTTQKLYDLLDESKYGETLHFWSLVCRDLESKGLDSNPALHATMHYALAQRAAECGNAALLKAFIEGVPSSSRSKLWEEWDSCYGYLRMSQGGRDYWDESIPFHERHNGPHLHAKDSDITRWACGVVRECTPEHIQAVMIEYDGKDMNEGKITIPRDTLSKWGTNEHAEVGDHFEIAVIGDEMPKLKWW